MLKNRNELLDCAQKMYEALLSKAAERHYIKPVYTQIDRAGLECTKLEELLRPMWGLAPVLKEREIKIHACGRTMTAAEFYKELMLEGTDPKSPERFDKNVTDYNFNFFANQATTELAGYLTCVYFAKEILWDILTKEEQDQIAGWIEIWAISAIKDSWPNNHYWYPIICIEILRKLGYEVPGVEQEMQKGFDVLESLYIDHGWYSDGEFGRFDYYESWAHHCYTLLYILIGDKNRPDYEARCERYRRRSEEFLEFFAHYFDSDGGMAAYGRSICYRFAATASYGLAALVGCRIDLGLAKRLILRNVSYFFDNSIMPADGVLPDGYLYDAFGFVENYTSEGSNCCYTEGFLPLLCGEDSPLWTAEETPIPVEQGNYIVRCPVEGIGIVVSGNNRKNGVTLFNNAVHYYQEEFFTKIFNDMAAYYGKFAYNSRSGYSISSRDQVSSENMITLYTPDGRMSSHRQEIHTISTDADCMVSWHRPFSNDENTVIKSWVIPLEEGFHVRVHEVKLSQRYIVLEGGFSVGVTDDAFDAGAGFVRRDNEISMISVTADVPANLESEAAHPGMHTLKPRSIYPCYRTNVLPAGRYRFATTVYYATDGIVEEFPKVQLTDEGVQIRFEGTSRSIALGK